jgi:hypothetical protein
VGEGTPISPTPKLHAKGTVMVSNEVYSQGWQPQLSSYDVFLEMKLTPGPD